LGGIGNLRIRINTNKEKHIITKKRSIGGKMDGQSWVSDRISSQAEEAVQRMLNVVNTDFAGGHLTRPELASWILIQFEKESLSGSIEGIRQDHFDPLIYVEAVLKQIKTAKANGALTPELQELVSSMVIPVPSVGDQRGALARRLPARSKTGDGEIVAASADRRSQARE
jgi:hypothetical protein